MFLSVTGCIQDPENISGVQAAEIQTRFEKMDPATGSRTPIDRTDVKRSSAHVIAAGGKVYMIGGFGEDLKLVDTVEAFDPVAGTWSTLTPWPTPRLVVSMVEVGERICASPGAGDVRLTQIESVWDCYDTAGDTWETLAKIAGNKDSISLGAHGGELYMLGGYDLAVGNPLDRAFRYDRTASSWVQLASLPAPCDTFHTITVGDTLFTLGCNTDKPSTEFFAYDVMTDTWSTPPPPPGVVSNHHPNQPLVYGDGFVYFTKAGGGEIWRYDAVAEEWSKSPPLPTRAGSFAYALVGDKLYVRLFTEEPTITTAVESGKIFAYDLLANSWAALPAAEVEPNLYLQGVTSDGSIYYGGDITKIVVRAEK